MDPLVQELAKICSMDEDYVLMMTDIENGVAARDIHQDCGHFERHYQLGTKPQWRPYHTIPSEVRFRTRVNWN